MIHPLIGVNLDFEDAPAPRSFVRATYYDAVHRVGGVPVLLPPIAEAPVLEAMLAHLQGLVLTGGDDLDPAHFGEPPHQSLRPLAHRRQEFDLSLARAALARKLPTLGICCGMQALNVLRGGSLIQDIPSLVSREIAHASEPGQKPAEHEVLIEPLTRLREIVGVDALSVHSAHHQSCARMGTGLTVSAYARDGIVEAWEDRGHPFLMGVQWHPERHMERPHSVGLFRALIEAARAFRAPLAPSSH